MQKLRSVEQGLHMSCTVVAQRRKARTVAVGPMPQPSKSHALDVCPVLQPNKAHALDVLLVLQPSKASTLDVLLVVLPNKVHALDVWRVRQVSKAHAFDVWLVWQPGKAHTLGVWPCENRATRAHSMFGGCVSERADRGPRSTEGSSEKVSNRCLGSAARQNNQNSAPNFLAPSIVVEVRG